MRLSKMMQVEIPRMMKMSSNMLRMPWKKIPIGINLAKICF